MKNWISEKGWDKVDEGGSGGRLDNKTKNTYRVPKSMEDFESAIAERGWTPGSQEANALFNQMAKDNPEILD